MNQLRVFLLGSWLALAGAAPAAQAEPFAYVANWADGTVTRIDTATNQAVGAPIAVGYKPEAVAIAPDGRRVYIANAWDNSISVIDTRTDAVVATITGINDPGALVFDAAGTRLFVSGGSSVEIIDTATDALVGAPIPLAPAGEQTYCPAFHGGSPAFDAQANRLYVPTIDSCIDSDPFHENGRIAVIDVQAGEALRLIEVERFPSSVTLDPAAARLYVTNWDSGSVSVLDRATGTVTGTITLEANAAPLTSVADADGSLLYVAAESGSVRVIDTASGMQSGDPIPVGNDPHGLALTGDGRTLYVANQGSDSVTAIDTATRQVSAVAIAVGSNPVAIAIGRSDALFASGFEAATN